MIRKIWVKYWPVIIITIVVFVFYSRLFFPEPSLYITPDFGRSDALNSNIPAKLELAKSLKSFELPTWTNGIGQGFPILAEGIAGTFYIPNLIIFWLFPLNMSIPVMYLSTFLIAVLGMYALLIKLKLNPAPSVIGALSFSFCASMMLHVQHFNFIQAASLLPIILYLILKMIERPNLKTSLMLAVIFSQLFFTGFVQIYAYSIVIFFILIVFYSYLTKNRHSKKLVLVYILITIASLIISAAQILPSLELNSKSGRAGGLSPSYILNSFPMPPINLETYINPFILGKAANGTYNNTNWSKNGIYWESTSYIGVVPLMLAFASIVFLFKDRKKYIYLVFLTLIFITILLSLGKSSPLHITFSFPPFNLFRVPSRFILFTQFFLAILAAYGTKKIIETIPSKFRPIIGPFLIAIIIADIFVMWWHYNPTGKFTEWTSQPETANIIQQIDSQARILSLGNAEAWNTTFIPFGWENKTDDYYFFRNALDQNINLLFGINQLQMFETLPTRRYSLQKTFLYDNIFFNENDITLNEKAKDLLDNSNVKFIVSTKQINNNNYKKIFEIKKNDVEYKIYQTDKNTGLGKIYYDYKTVKTTSDYNTVFNEIDLQKTVVLEKEFGDKQYQQGSNNVELQKQTNSTLEFDVETQYSGIFVTPISYFPGWEATIDKQKTTILPANINSQALEIPAGKHNIKFTYKPKSLKIGLIISLLSYLLILLIIVRTKRQKPHKPPTPFKHLKSF